MAEVRPIEADEIEAWVAAMKAGFLDRVADGEAAFRAPAIDPSRTLAAMDGGRIVGTTRSFPSELTLPGGRPVPVSAVTNVAVLPTHRRQGLLRGMMEQDLAAAAARGDAAAILIASEYRIYGRYGYGPATAHRSLALDASATFREPGRGHVELVEPAEHREIAPVVFEAHRRTSAGEITRSDRRWDVTSWVVDVPGREGDPPFFAVSRDDDGTPIGALSYRLDTTWEARRSKGVCKIDELIAVDAAAAARLWRFAAEIDWITRVESDDRSPDDPLPWFLEDARMVSESARADFLWLRILDVPAVLSGRTFRARGEVSLEVLDPAGHAAGVFRLAAGPDGARCEPGADAPQVRLGVTALGAAVLGGASVEVLAAAGLVTGDPAAVGTLADLLACPGAPWCMTWF